MIENGFIKLHRKMIQWEWYNDVNVKILFLHLLLTANYEDKKWQGKVIKRGQRVCSYSVLSKELKLSVRSIRTSLNKLKMTGEVTSETTSKYSLISIVNYDLYQDERQAKGQSGDKQATSKRQATDNNERKIKKDKKDKEYIYSDFFEKLWKLYPKKQGKGSVSDTQKEKLYKIGFEEMSRAVNRYIKYIADNGIEEKYIKQGSTFFNSGYVDYLDSNYQQEEEQKSPQCYEVEYSEEDLKPGLF